MMNWIDHNKNAVRICLLVGLVAAFLGPCVYDQINVPAEYPCQPPNVRLEGDFCGLPLPGTWMLVGAASILAYTANNVLAGTLDYEQIASEFFFIIFGFLFVLPFFSTLILLLRAERRGWQIFNLTAWSLAAGLGLLMGVAGFQSRFWMLWGVWLYVAVAIFALVVEVRWLRRGRNT
jgi:hypothetical protein